MKIKHVAEATIQWEIGEGKLPSGLLHHFCAIWGPPTSNVASFIEQGRWNIDQLLQVILGNAIDQVLKVPIALS
ncbi:hypothetical protein F511_44344 [Dorcoceras hygrometricum]|uniref:Uncharacterized protein n=1 Tax=Dorcoceras hygrometricum TaxID=472368 RepID=A0A2Z7C9M7_9LAMI|nr:hypothetical protein F511_44344 [Dorcoceras hygrometricum]